VFHVECLAHWIDFNKKKNGPNSKSSCPYCRRDIDEAAIVKRKYRGLLDPQDEMELGMAKAPSKVSDVFADNQRIVDPQDVSARMPTEPDVLAPDASMAAPQGIAPVSV